MQYDQFVGQVQHRARLASSGESVRAIRAVLETLAERLSGGEPKDLASQLPQEIGVYLTPELQGGGERFSLREFYSRVSLREGVDFPKAVHHTRSVMQVVREAVSNAEIEDVKSQLPEEYEALFQPGSQADELRK